MKILLIGKNGQVGWELQCLLFIFGDVVVVDYFDKLLCGDLINLEGIVQIVCIVCLDVVVNVVVYMVVDKVESEWEFFDLLNDKGVVVLVVELVKLGVLMVYYFMDYVFDGVGSYYCWEDEVIGLLNVYGEIKCVGELVLEQGNLCYLIFCISWVYVICGVNFVKMMFCLVGEKEMFFIIDDQYGVFIGVELLVDCMVMVICEMLCNLVLVGIYYLVVSGEISWCDYVCYVFEVVRVYGVELVVQEVKGILMMVYLMLVKCLFNLCLLNEKFQQVFGVIFLDWCQGVVCVVIEVFGK